MTVKKFIWPLAVLVLAVLLGALSVRAQNDLPEYTIISEEGAENECDEIGTWDAASKTCTLTDDVSGRVAIFESGVTFDGAGYTLSGRGEGYGMEFFGGEAVLKNLTVQNFSDALALYGGTSTVRNVQVQNSSGVGLEVFGENSVVENTTIENFSSGVKVYEGRSTVKNVELSQGEVIGLVSYGDDATVEDISVKDMQNGYGLRVFGQNTDVKNVRVRNVMNGVYAAARTVSFSGLDLQEGAGKGLHVVSVAEVADFRIENFNTGVAAEGENMSFSNGTLRGNNTAMRFDGEEFFVTAMNFIGSFEQDVFMDLSTVLFYEPPKFIGNYWDKYDEPAEGCEDPNQDGICNLPYDVLPFSLFRERVRDRAPQVRPIGKEQKPEPECSENCFSNVAFLPGIQASRLYKRGSVSENTLWEPNRNADVEKLFMDAGGESISDNIYTKDVLDRVYGVGTPIYANFITFMNDISGEDKTINDWKAFPYDWRYDVRDVATGVIPTESDGYNIGLALEKLAEKSKTGQVTIIAHSNGGLLGKAAISELEKQGKADLIDKFIMVGTPQLGTPKAIASILNGEGQEKANGFVVEKATGRKAALNMPGAYGLLPFPDYFKTTTAESQLPVYFVSKLPGSAIEKFEDYYDGGIETSEEMYDFLLGADGRNDAAYSDTGHPAIANVQILEKAKNTQQFLQNWTAPQDVQVVQIAGWGLPTISGMTYTEKLGCIEALKSCAKAAVDDFNYEPEMTVQGDGTVMSQSAAKDKDAETYYLNLKKYNRAFEDNKAHANMLEIGLLQDALKNIIRENTNGNSPYITINEPKLKSDDRRHLLRILSPVSLGATDEDGDYTGLKENPKPGSDIKLVNQDIPNSYYMEFGEGKYLGFGEAGEKTVTLNGTGSGTFTFEITEVVGDEERETITYRDIPVTPTTQATIQIQTLDNRSALELDTDGDGTTDVSLNGSSNVEGEEKHGPVDYMKLIWDGAQTMDLNFGVEKCISLYFKRIQYERDQGVSTSELRDYVDSLLFQLEDFEKTGYLSKKNLDVLKKQLSILKELVE